MGIYRYFIILMCQSNEIHQLYLERLGIFTFCSLTKKLRKSYDGIQGNKRSDSIYKVSHIDGSIIHLKVNCDRVL